MRERIFVDERMQTDGARRGLIGGSNRLHPRDDDESLSPPPPRAFHQYDRNPQEYSPSGSPIVDDEASPYQRQRDHRHPVATSAQVLSAAEAVASALNISPAIRRRAMESDIQDLYSLSEWTSSSIMKSDTDWSRTGYVDLGTIAESPHEVRLKHSPDDAHFNGDKVAFRGHSTTTTASTHNGNSVSLSSSTPSSPSRQSRQTRRSVRSVQHEAAVGAPVSFYVDGHADRYFGRVKAISSSGLYTVDLVGGGLMAGLELVTPCRSEDLRKAESGKRRLDCSPHPYAEFHTRNKDLDRSLSPGRSFQPGALVSFTVPKHDHSVPRVLSGLRSEHQSRFCGRVQKRCDDGSYIVELPGGARRTGVRHLKPCTDRDLEKMEKLSHGFVTHMDDYDSTRNAPAWGGGSGYSGGWRERSPPPRERVLGKSFSASVLHVSHHSSGNQSHHGKQRSLSPQACNRRELRPGTPVYFLLEGEFEPRFGWILHSEADGSYTVNVVGGRRIVGLREVKPCTDEDIEKVAKLKAPMVTRTDAWAEFETPNRPPRSPSPVPRLRGVAINLPPRSATCMNAF